MTDTTAKKDIQKLQRAIVDGLEDVKAIDIKVFDTTRLSPLFERVVIASGNSNRQTKALAASVRDKLREAGLPKPRTEGEDNGEWIIVDCGAAVVHVMQPSIRTYYNLEEIWGDTPVRMKFGAPRPAVTTGKAPAKTSRSGGGTSPAAKKNAASPREKAGKGAPSRSESPVAAPKKAAKKSAPSIANAKQSATKKEVKKVIVPATARKTPARKTSGAARPAAKKTTSRKA